MVITKPTIKREVAISSTFQLTRTVLFYSTNDAANDFVEFGKLVKLYGGELYHLEVDNRFDFDEVVNYIENYDSQNSESLFGE